MGLQVPAVKTDNLIMDYNKMGVVIHMVALTNRAIICAFSSKNQHIADNLFSVLAGSNSLTNLTMAWTFSSVNSVSILGALAAGFLVKIEGSLKLPSGIYAKSKSLKALNTPDLYCLTLELL